MFGVMSTSHSVCYDTLIEALGESTEHTYLRTLSTYGAVYWLVAVKTLGEGLPLKVTMMS